MTTKSRIRKVEQVAHTGEPVNISVRVVWTDEERLEYEGRNITEEEWERLVKEGKIIHVTGLKDEEA